MGIKVTTGLEKVLPGKEIYNDAISPAMKQIGLMAENGVKVARFLWAPIDYLAAMQDRWQRYLSKIAGKVSEENLTQGEPYIIHQVVEKLNIIPEESLLSDLFINLLSNSVDKTKQELIHPAFPNIISQLSEDEAVLLYFLKRDPIPISVQVLAYDEVKNLYEEPVIRKDIFNLDKLSFPHHYDTYINHLNSLNLIQEVKIQKGKSLTHFRTLSPFGNLFAKSCIPDTFQGLQNDSCG